MLQKRICLLSKGIWVYNSSISEEILKIFNDIYANTDKFIENTNISFLYSGDLVSRDDIKKMMVEPSNEDMFFCYSYNDSLDFSQLTKAPRKTTTKKKEINYAT